MTSKYDISKSINRGGQVVPTDERLLQELPDPEVAKQKFLADQAINIDWKPTFSRIKILPDPETTHGGLIQLPNVKPGSLSRGTIVAIGPEVGHRDGVEVETFRVGQRVLYMTGHPMTYKGANGVEHHFLKENSDITSIIAVEPIDG
jgi:co-chaperonin GroES (HSP10)